MASSLVWINASNAKQPKLNATELSEVRAQARREARRLEREAALRALRRPTNGVNVGTVRFPRRMLPKHSSSLDTPDQRKPSVPVCDATKVKDKTASRSTRSFTQSDNACAVDNRSTDEVTDPSKPTIPPPVYSVASTQQALAAAFIKGHLCEASYKSFAAVSQQAERVTPCSRSWAASTNALGLLQLGSVADNSRLAEEGQRQYGQMLRFLQEELVSANLDLVAVTATVYHLLLCETYSAVPQSKDTRQKHFAGMATLVDRMASPLHSTPLVMSMLRPARFLLALINRDPGPLMSVSRCVKDQASSGSGLDTLLQLAMRVPYLLQAADNARKSCNRHLLPIIQEVRRLESAFDGWFESSPLMSATDTGGPATDAVRFHTSLQPSLAHLEQVFGRSSTFASFDVANIHVLYWTCLLLLRMSLLDLARTATVRGDSEALSAVTDRSLEVDCLACATSLCKSVPFLLQEAGGNVSQAASIRGPLYFAQLCFDSTDSTLELECVKTAEAEMRCHFRALNWDALLPWTFLALIWQTSE